MITLLGQSKKFRVVKDNIKKLFMGMNSLEQNEEQTHIKTMLSCEDEHLDFCEPVETKTRTISVYIKDVEKFMKTTLVKIVENGIGKIISVGD